MSNLDDLVVDKQPPVKDSHKQSLERQKSLIIKKKEAEVAQLKLDTFNIYASILIKFLVLILIGTLYLEWDTVITLWQAVQD